MVGLSSSLSRTDDTEEKKPKQYQDFIIGSDAKGQPIKHTSDSEKLANHFGKNSDAPNYLTAVYFRPEVLSKYYADPAKYSVEDGYLRCGGLWGIGPKRKVNCASDDGDQGQKQTPEAG